jgi:single-stranded DNA-binding protein
MSRTESLPSVHLNVVVLRGVLSSPPRARELPSGDSLTLLEVTTRGAAEAATAPVVLLNAGADVAALDAGAEVVVVGRVARRYFRADGVTQSRTEVLAELVVPGGQRRFVDRALRRAVRLLGTGGVRVR